MKTINEIPLNTQCTSEAECPNCWGYQEYAGQHNTSMSASLVGSLKKKKPIAFIQRFMEKYLG